MADDLDSTIQETVQGPAEVQTDGVRVKAQSVKDQIEADRYLAAKDAAKNKKLGVRFAKLVPPGSV